MSQAAEFEIGSEVACSDGSCGELTRVVVDPVLRALTHLVVEPRHGRHSGHLVPLDLVEASDGEIVLRCTLAEFDALESAEESEFVPAESPEGTYGKGHVLTLPYFILGMGMDASGAGTAGMGSAPHVVTRDRVPLGEIELCGGEHVHATDGNIGRVRGLVIDPDDRHVTHLLLDEGHLWGQKTVAIPISAVADVKDGVRLSLTRDQVRDLPAVDVIHSQ